MGVPRPEEMVADLSADDIDTRLRALRQVKNQIIGNKTKKLEYLRLGAVPKVVSILAEGEGTSMLMQSAAAVGSFSYGIDDGVQAVLDSGGLAYLLQTLSHSDEKVVEMGMRALKMVYQSPVAPREAIFESPALNRLISVLQDPQRLTAEVAACILARCCQQPGHQRAVAAAQGLEALAPMLKTSRWSCREAALKALVAITADNPSTCEALLKCCPEIIATTLELTKEKRPNIRLAACSLMTHLARNCPAGVLSSEAPEGDPMECSSSGGGGEGAGAGGGNTWASGGASGAPGASVAAAAGLLGGAPGASLRVAVLPTLMKLLGDPEVRESVPHVLSLLVEDREDLQKLAADADAISKLAAFLRDGACDGLLLEGTLHALGTLCMSREESRKQLMEAKVLGPIVRALEHSKSTVREAACLCVRSLSRTVKQQRTALVDADVAAPLLRLLQDPSTEVQLMASATLCNMVLDFSPIKDQVLKMGGAAQLVELTRSMDRGLRRNAVSALKNLVFQSDLTLKAAVVQELGWATMKELVEDPEEDVAMEALQMLRNLLHKKAAEIDIVMKAAGGSDQVLAVLMEKLDLELPRPPRLVREVLMAVSNIATGSEDHKELLMQARIPALLLHYLQLGASEHEATRLAAAWTVINLTYAEGSAGPGAQAGARSRAERLAASGIREQMEQMREDPSQDVQERVNTALQSFQDLLAEPRQAQAPAAAEDPAAASTSPTA